jgi:hypothetical protein
MATLQLLLNNGLFIQYLFDSTDDAALQPYFDAVGMRAGFCQNVCDDSVCKNAGALVLLLDNLDLRSHLNVSSISSVHHSSPVTFCLVETLHATSLPFIITYAAARASSFLFFGVLLIFISRRSASVLDINLLAAISAAGSLALVYREAVPLLCAINRRAILFVVPVYSVLSRQRRIYTTHFLSADLYVDFAIVFYPI